MSFFKKWFNKEPKEQLTIPSLPWIEAADNPWGVRLLDLRPVTQNMLATSSDPLMATNAVSYGAEDGSTFKNHEPADPTIISGDITIPTDAKLMPGVLFVPATMEHKWAIYYRDSKIIFVRSWQRQVLVRAKTIQEENKLIVESISGRFTGNEGPEFTRSMFKFLLQSHVLDQPAPAPLPNELKNDTKNAGLWAFSLYGNMANVGIFNESFDIPFAKPLRSHSLLHIAVAKSDVDEIEKQFQSGHSLDLLAGDGLNPLQWSVAAESIGSMEKLLALGAPVDSRSDEGATPLMNAVQSNKIPHFKLLLHAGADVNAADNRGFTCLHRAAEKGYIDMVKMLLQNGARKEVSTQGFTALAFAENRGHTEIVNLLRE